MDISKSTTVNSLLDEYPQLQQVLIDLNPQFKKLRNPLLRKSIGRVATLEQAAAIANIPSVELINHLRQAVNQAPIPTDDSTDN
ncbi:MAG: DUF1858 domain-containing protein [Cyanobacteria bacterium J06560_6]